MELEHFLAHALPSWMYATNSQDDIVMSTRIRLARNLTDFRFPLSFSENEAMQVDKAVRQAFEDVEFPNIRFSYFQMKEMTALQRQALIEKHLISPQLAKKEVAGAFILSDDESISILINEEDHLRIQCLSAGLHLAETYKIASQIDRMLELQLSYAYHEDFGYLTSCPTNIGTGLRASVMLHLPALTMTNQMDPLVQAMARLGMTVRGIYGEGSGNLGNVYQVSNQITLGKTEEDILIDLQSVAEKFIQKERQARQALLARAGMMLEDRVHRSLGTLTSARILSSEESATCLSNVILGVDLGLIDNISKATLMECKAFIQPGFLQLAVGMSLQPGERDIYRAKMLREILQSKQVTQQRNLGEKGEGTI